MISHVDDVNLIRRYIGIYTIRYIKLAVLTAVFTREHSYTIYNVLMELLF